MFSENDYVLAAIESDKLWIPKHSGMLFPGVKDTERDTLLISESSNRSFGLSFISSMYFLLTW